MAEDSSKELFEFFQMILSTASGGQSKSEAMGYGEDEFAPWVLGPTM